MARVKIDETILEDAVLTMSGGMPHNNMPPYIAIYMWRRTA